MSDTNESLPTGQQRVSTAWGEFNRLSFLIQQALSKMQTATLVRVVACTNTGGLSPVGTVDVTPLVNQLDGDGNPTEHSTIYNIPYSRIQGGANGIIIDPVTGDIGMCVFASRDISKVKSTKNRANPGSFRQYHFSDGMYLGGMLNDVPTQYVQFSASGIKIHSPVAVILDAPDVQINAATVEINGSTSTAINTPTFTVTGNTVLHGTVSQTGGGTASLSGTLTVTGDVTANGISLDTHHHTGVTTGGGNTGGPV